MDFEWVMAISDAMAIERVQAAVARSILRAPFRTPKTDLFKQLNWLSLRWRREIASMTLFHKLLLTRPPPLDFCFSALHRRSAVASCGNHINLSCPKHIPVNTSTAHFSTGHHKFGTLSQQLFRTSHVIRRLRKKLKINTQALHPIQSNSMQFTKSSRGQHTLIKDNIILPFYHPIFTVGLLILILDLLLFPPPLLPELSSLLTYSLLFYLSPIEQVFFIFLYRSLKLCLFFSSWRPPRPGLSLCWGIMGH